MATELRPFDGQLDTPPRNLKPFTGELDPPESPKRTALDVAKDVGITALKGAVGLPQSVVGVADLFTGGRAGKAVEDAGVHFKDAQDILADQYSDAQKAANRKVAEADGFVGTAQAMLANPSTIATSVGESIPQMLGGAGVARGVLAAGAKVAPAIAGAIGEGVLGAGSQAEQIRQETMDGLLTPEQAALAAASGVTTTAFGAAGGRVAQRLGIGDADTMLAQGSIRGAGPASQRSLARQVGEGVLSEGVLEEVPQSMAEQALQNLALDKPVGEGVGAAAAQGLLAGGAMGGGAALVHGAGARGESAAGAPAPAGAPAAEPLQLGYQPDTLVAFPDGTVGRQAEVDAYLARLPEDQRAAARTRLMGLAPQPSPPTTETPAGAPAVRAAPLPSQAMGIDPAAGPLSTGAAIAVHSGAHGQLLQDAQRQADAAALAEQEEATAANRAAPPVLDYSDLDERDRALYDDYFHTLDRETEGHMAAALEDDVPDFGDRNVTDEQFLRALGANDQEIADAIQAARGATGPEERAGGAVAPAADVAQGAQPAAAAAPAEQGRAEPAETVAAPAAPAATVDAGAAPTSVQDGIARARARRSSPPAPAPAPAPAAAPAPAVPSARREKAQRRVEEGKAWFLSQAKADAFVSENGLADTHEVVPENRRFVVKRRAAPIAAPSAPVDAAANEAATSPQNERAEPTQAQKEAGNYKMGHLSGDEVQGLRISIENPQGSTRSGTSPDGRAWSNTMAAHYGYVKGSEAADGDHVDVFVGPHAATAPTVYVVDQVNADGSYDEAKALFGFNSEAEAVAAYRGSYDANWKVGPVTAMSVDEFKAGLASGRFKGPVSNDLEPAAAADRPSGPAPAPARAMDEARGDAAAPDQEKKRSAKESKATARAAESIQDAGEKIGGARKDRWKERGLNVSDLNEMSEAEGAELATKANIWKPDWSALVSGGMNPVTAASAKVIYDRLAAQPKDNTPAGRRRYVRAMQAVRAVYSALTPENMAGAKERLLFDHLQWTDGLGATSNDRARRNAEGVEDLAAHRREARATLFSVYKGRSDPFVLDHSDLMRVRKMVADGFPAKGEPWARRFGVRESSGKSLTPRGRELTLEQSAEMGTPLTADQIAGSYFEVRRQIGGRVLAYAMTRADAEAAARRLYESELASATRGKEPERPHLDVLQRAGLPQRLDRDATPDDFIRDFGFRGIEFGNWSAQDERQRIINMAYDGLSDLAQVMGVPPSAMSLNGTMGLAFGARGGGRFAAHYEPGRLVINMTKIRGGGSLAHEWAHALDHYFGELEQGDAYQGRARGASGWYEQGRYDGTPQPSGRRGRLENLRPELASAFDRVMSTIYREQLDRAALVREAELTLERAQARLAGTTDEDLKRIFSRGVESARQSLNETLGLPPDAVRQGRKESSYYESSLGIKEGKESYWTRPTEMFARAFESWVFDRIKAMGARSDYLVHGVESGVQYPAGLERARINEAFDQLAATIETRAGENGNTALFRRGDDGLAGMSPEAANAMRALSRPTYSPQARTQAVATVRKTVDAIRSAWGNAPDIVVAFDMNDAAVPEAARRADLRQRSGGARGAPEGFYYRGKAYLMASRLATAEDAARVLYHEVLGHHGLRGTFGKQLDGVLNQIATMRRAEVDAKVREYGLRGVNKLDRRAAAEEVLAEMAQNTPELHFVRRAVAAIRTWLRENVPGFRGLRLTDDEIIRNFILPARAFVERSAGAAAPRTGLAFSRAEGVDPDAESRAFLDGAPVAHLSGKEFAPDGVPITEKVTEHYATTGNAQVEVPGIGLVSLDRQAVKSSLFHGIGRDKATAFAAVPDVLKNGKIIHAESMEGARDAGMVYHVAAPVRIGDRDMVEVVLVKADSNARRMYVHEVVLREKLRQPAVEAGAGAAEAGVRTRADAGAIRSVLDRIYTVNRAAEEGGPRNVQEDSGDEPEPMFSRSTVGEYARTAAAELNKTFNAPGRLSWWHKTIGTMYNLAERSPAFKPVFDAAQGFVDDVSHYATDAAELAPKLLPKLETWRDIKKSPISAADNTAVAKPVFEGTLTWARDEQGVPVQVQTLIDAAAGLTSEQKAQRLLRNGMLDERMLKAWQGMPLESYEKAVASRYESRMLQPGVVWSDAELRSMFQLTDDQVALYREFREATNRSLDTMARADMLRFAGDDAKGLRTIVMDAPDAQAAAVLIRDHLAQLAGDQPDRATLLMNTANGIMDRADKVRDLQARGYAPLSRFGRYSVDVVDAKGERQYFGLFETARDANTMAARMRAEFGEAAVSQGTLSEEAFKMFAGVTPETLELFGNALGLDSTGDRAQDQAFQEYLKLTKTNRSAMRRLIHRKGIAGFSEDVGRVLASFIYSNARQTAAGLNLGNLGEAVNAIPKEQGELKDVAVRLAEYVKNPQEEARAVRGLLFAQYLGGSIASAFVNMTQPAAVTFPWLSQFGGARKAAAALGTAAKNMATKGFEFEPDLAKALKTAEDEGVVAPQEVHQLMAQARGSGSLRAGDGTRLGEAHAAGQNALARLSLAWGKVFGAAEQVNRRITFIAAYRVARDRGDANPAAFAGRAVRETQFVYSKASKMQWGRGAVGGVLMTFKTYSIAYLELLHRMYTQGGPEGKRAALLALGMLMLMGGSGGLPFAEDAEDGADALAQLLGYNFSAKKARQEVFEAMLPKGIADFLDKGVSGLPGAPLDVSGRLGMGNLIPGTGLLQQKTSHTRDVLEIAGPAGDFASRIFSGALSVAKGNVGAGALEVAPTAVRNAAKGVDMAATGMYRDAKGYKVLETNHLEAALKAIGFQPQSVATIQEANGINQQAKAFYNLRAQEIRAQWAAGIFEKDEAKVRSAREAIADWNAKNPDQPMVIRITDVNRRVREMSKSKDQRIADTAPRAMRQQMREDATRALAG